MVYIYYGTYSDNPAGHNPGGRLSLIRGMSLKKAKERGFCGSSGLRGKFSEVV